jgi:hypothetical protein
LKVQDACPTGKVAVQRGMWRRRLRFLLVVIGIVIFGILIAGSGNATDIPTVKFAKCSPVDYAIRVLIGNLPIDRDVQIAPGHLFSDLRCGNRDVVPLWAMPAGIEWHMNEGIREHHPDLHRVFWDEFSRVFKQWFLVPLSCGVGPVSANYQRYCNRQARVR